MSLPAFEKIYINFCKRTPAIDDVKSKSILFLLPP